MATYQEQYDDPLAMESAPSLSFKDATPGTVYTGTIVRRPRLVQARDFDTGNPKTWPDGNPVMSVVLLLDVQGETRSLWAQKPSSMFAALVQAQKAAGAGPMQEGGTLHVKFDHSEPNRKNPKLNDIKVYAAKYIPPVTTEDPFDAVEPSPAPAQRQAAGVRTIQVNVAPQATPAARPAAPTNRPAW